MGQVIKRSKIGIYASMSTDALRTEYKRKCDILKANREAHDRGRVSERKFFQIMRTTKQHLSVIGRELKERGEHV